MQAAVPGDAAKAPIAQKEHEAWPGELWYFAAAQLSHLTAPVEF